MTGNAAFAIKNSDIEKRHAEPTYNASEVDAMLAEVDQKIDEKMEQILTNKGFMKGSHKYNYNSDIYYKQANDTNSYMLIVAYNYYGLDPDVSDYYVAVAQGQLVAVTANDISNVGPEDRRLALGINKNGQYYGIGAGGIGAAAYKPNGKILGYYSVLGSFFGVASSSKSFNSVNEALKAFFGE